MNTEALAVAVTNYMNAQLDRYLADLRTLVAIDSGTHHKPGVDAVQDWMQARLSQLGFKVERLRQPILGDNVLATRHGAGTSKVLLLGHADTVFPVGTAAERPLRIEAGKVLGPGSCDMKAGLLSGIYAVEALDAAGYRDYATLLFLVVCDEEIHERCSLQLIRSTARLADVAYTLEAARANGDIVTARKTAVWGTVKVQGRAAHAGVEPEKGRSAILALIRHLEAIDRLNGLRPGVTVNIGRIDGGTQPNVVAEHAMAELDFRGWNNADIPLLVDAIRAQLATPTVPDTEAWLDVDISIGMPAMERTADVVSLEEKAQRYAHILGFEVGGASTGGASDASFVAAEGTPVLDGLGPIGGLDHSPAEYVDLASIAPRTALLALMIAGAGK